MLDGRNKNRARPGAIITTTIALVGLGFVTAAPASAAPNDIDSLQAQVDRLTARADAVAQRHDGAAQSLAKTRKQLRTVQIGLNRQRALASSLQQQLADLADEGDGTTAQPSVYDASRGTAVAPVVVKGASAQLLTNVVIVSEDTGGLAQRMASTDRALETLTARRAALRDRVDAAQTREQALKASESSAQGRAAAVNAQLDKAQQKAEADRVGPAVQFAMAQVGKAYVYGAAGPSAFDCSGLTMAAWATAGVSLPHSSSAQYSSGRHISESELQPGDLVFYYSPISHVGMYIGNGQIVNALNPGAGVKISGLHDMPYVGAVRPG